MVSISIIAIGERKLLRKKKRAHGLRQMKI